MLFRVTQPRRLYTTATPAKIAGKSAFYYLRRARHHGEIARDFR
jgi:hypothetical protein